MNTDEYLNQVHRIIRDNFRSTDASGGMPVATVAYLAKQTIGSNHAPFGFLKFKDVLQSLEASGLVNSNIRPAIGGTACVRHYVAVVRSAGDQGADLPILGLGGGSLGGGSPVDVAPSLWQVETQTVPCFADRADG